MKIFLPVALLLVFATHAEGLAQRTFAVVVGVSDYLLGERDRGDLNFCDDDARAFYAFLRSAPGGSVPKENIVLLVDNQATQANILTALELYRRANPSDRVIFFFSGHGDQGVFLPYDVSATVVLRHSEVKAAFRQSAARTKLLLADACMAGSMRTKVAPPSPAVLATPAADTPTNVVVMLSSRSNQVSQETQQLQHGAFTYFLIQGSNGPADTDKNGIVTIQELYSYLRGNVRAITRNRQSPVVYGKFEKTMPFAVNGREESVKFAEVFRKL